MEFGKLPRVDGVDFRLPAEDARSRQVLSGRPAASPRVYVGPTGWTTKEWLGRVYPPQAAGAALLQHYGQAFTTVELNTTHYRVPDEATVARWREAVPEDFRFAPKFPQEVSHAPVLAEAVEAARLFCARMGGLGEKLGRSFLQLPPGFGPSQASQLAAFLDALPAGYPLAVELRHPGWFSRGWLVPSLFRLLADRGVVAVMTGVAGRRDVLHATLTAPAGMVRFVGNGLHPTDFTRLDAWVERLAGWLAAGVEEVFFFTHEPDNVLAPELSNALVERLNRTCGLSLRAWRPWQPPGGTQLSLL